MAGHKDLTIDQGETYELVVTYKDSDGELVNLAGYDAKMQIRDGSDWSLVLDIEQPVGGGIVLGGAAGTVTATIPAATTMVMPEAEVLAYDLQVIAPNGNVTFLSEGSVRVRRAATQDFSGGDAFANGLYTIDGGSA